MATTTSSPWQKIAKIWSEQILNWKKIPVYDYMARYDNDRYEAEIQDDLDIIAALSEMRNYRDKNGLAAYLPPASQDLLSGLAVKGLLRFQRIAKPARLFWQLPIFLGFIIAIIGPILISRRINDEIYFISKVSTAAVTIYMLIPYMYDGLLSLEMLWKFAETRLIHPLAPLLFVILAFIPEVDKISAELWYKAISGILGLIILTFFIFVVSLKKNHLLGKIKNDVPNRRILMGDDERAFEVARLASLGHFERGLTALLKREKGADAIEISTAKRDQVSFRKDTFATFAQALHLYSPEYRTPRKRDAPRRLIDSTRRALKWNDPYWETYHHPLPKSPVLVIETGFMATQLFIYRGYLATFIDTVVTQARVIMKLAKLISDPLEPAAAALAEFSRLVAGAIVGFFILGIPFALLGKSWVEGNNTIYLCFALTAAKFLLSNHVAPTIDILGLLLFMILWAIWTSCRTFYRYITSAARQERMINRLFMAT